MERLRLRSPEFWAVVSVLLSLWVCMGALEGIPHVTDEVVYTLQARIFASGARTAEAADVPSMLSYPFWVTGPHSHAAFPFGWPLLLSIGEAVGVGWLVNPLLMGAVVWLTHAVGRPIVGAEAAERGAMVVALSPALLLLGASRMSHTSTIVALLLAAWPVVAEGPRWRWALGGLGVGYAVTARPFDALLVGGMLLSVGAYRLVRRQSWGPLFLFVGPAAMATGWVLLDNLFLQGDPFVFPADAFFQAWTPERPGCNRLGFGADVGCIPVGGTLGHELTGALAQAADRARLLDRLLLGIPLLGGVAVLAGLRKPVLLLPLGLVAVGYLLYWSPGMAYGPRFWAIGVPGLALALATAFRGPMKHVAAPVAVAGSALGLAHVWPELSDRYWCVDGRLSSFVGQLPTASGVLLVEAKGTRVTGWPRLGVETFTCDPMLEFGDALLLWHPVDATWETRHALSDSSQNGVYLERFQPGEAAWLIRHDVAADERTVSPLR